MELEFQESYNMLREKCPPKNYKPKNIESVYRWIFENMEDTRNFQSQYEKNPKRFQLKSDAEKCKGIALSMFNNLDGAKARFAEIAEDMGEKTYQILGNKIAKGHLTTECGLNGVIEKHGHFTHHPAKGIPSKPTFEIIDNLIA
jgi:hypothetical protein